eukprot:COSAG01_NODE_2459_length_7655_cov_138.985442_5_plen_180_part_00
MWYSIVDTATKNKTKSPPLKVPVHLRCPRFAKFLIEWREIMGEYQNTDEPWLLCNMSKKVEERTPLYKSEDSQAAMKWNSQTVRNYDKRVWESCGVDGPHDATLIGGASCPRICNTLDKLLGGFNNRQNAIGPPVPFLGPEGPLGLSHPQYWLSDWHPARIPRGRPAAAVKSCHIRVTL